MTRTGQPDRHAPKVFISYSHKDKKWMDRLVTHLGVLGSQGLIDVWDDRQIGAGQDWEEKIESAMGTCAVAVLLVSADFLTSKFVLRKEIPILLERAEEEGVRMFPVILRACTWQRVSWLARMQCRPEDGEPILAPGVDDPTIDAAFAEIADEIADIVAPETPPGSETGSSTSQKRRGGRPAPPADGPPRNNFASVSALFNEDFVGREAILADLHTRLQQGDVALTHALPDTRAAAQALRGEGGIGKTQIAMRYAFEHADDYDGTWWMDASRPAMDASAAKLATVLGMAPGPQETPEIIAGRIREKLSKGRHLLILDNLEEPERLGEFLLQPPGRVLITTRLGSLPTGQVHQVAISIFERHESIALLRKHRPDLEDTAHDEALGLVAEALGDHALAVALGASYLRKRASVTPGELLERLQRANLGEKAHVFAKMDAGEHAAGYALSVAKSLGLHLPDFRDTPAMALLTLAALCHPDDIPVELFVDCTELDQEQVEDWLEKLADVSIIRYDAKGVQVHRLMQEVVRAEVGEDVCRTVIAKLVEGLNARFAEDNDPTLWAIQDGYASHAESCIEHAERLDVTEGTGLLANQLGLYHKNRARFDTALALFRTAERIHRKAFGDEHPEVAIDVNNIGELLRTKGDLDGALKCYREAERIGRKAFGDVHPSVAVFVNNIGMVLHTKGDLDGALECFREAERIDRKAFGDEHPEVATDVNNIGGVLQDKGDLDGALECFREAERIDRKAFGDEHPNVAIRVNNIGGVLFARGDLAGAQEKMTEAFRILVRTYGPRS
ncbi:MAG: tetratricopeptide repeat protein, partial [Planctomycetes bacterium]|nr:tetratricopeptide repeat protein [Planctomycetota bacterium]